MQRASVRNLSRHGSPVALGLALVCVLGAGCTSARRDESRSASPSSSAQPPGKCLESSGIPSDGSVDVTAALQALIDSVPDGGCIAFPTGTPSDPVRYRIDGGLRLVDGYGISIHGNGAELFSNIKGELRPPANRSNRAFLRVVRGGDIRINDLVFNGPNQKGNYYAPYEEEAGIRLSGVDGATLQDLSVREVFGDAVSVYDYSNEGAAPIPSRDVRVSHLVAERIGRQGVAVVAANGVTIEDGVFNDIARSVFDLEPLPRRTVTGVRIQRNRVGAYENTFVAGLGAGKKDDITIAFNTSTIEPLWIKLVASNVTVEGNTGAGLATRPMIQINGGDHIRVVANTQAFAGRGVKCPPNCGIPAVALRGETGAGVCDAFAAGNTFTGARRLFAGDPPSRPCAWVDGGGNEI